MFDTLIRRVQELAVSQPEKEAVIFRNRSVTYGALADEIRAAGKVLGNYGVRPGDRVLFSALSKPEMVVTYLGIQYCGGVAVFIDKNSEPQNAADIYTDTQAALFLTDKPMKGFESTCRIKSLRGFYDEVLSSADKVPYEGGSDMHRCDDMVTQPVHALGSRSAGGYELPDEESIAELLFTTGTTGRPKGVMLSYGAVYNILTNTIRGIGIREDDRVLIPLPLNHSFALRVLRAVLYRGAAVVLQNGFTFAKELENNITQHHCTALATVPASLELTRSQMQDKFAGICGKLRYIEVGAGSLTTRQRKEFTALLPDTHIYNTWGSSETGGALFADVTDIVKDPEKIKAVGCPLPGVGVRVTGSEGEAIEHSDQDHPGRLALRGAMIMSGYWNRPDLTAETLHDGWLVTNDLVYTDSDGYVYMLGRSDDIINVGGEKVSPIEVENIAGQYEAIRECACIGVPDPNEVLGQIPALFVAPGGGYTEDGLRKYLADHLERYKIPQEYVTVDALPRNRMKKLDRRTMRKMWDERSEGAELSNPVIDAILSRRSVRKFTDRSVPGELLDMILKAGYHAPSGHNMQTWQFTVIRDQDKILRLKNAAAAAAKENKVYFYGFNNPQAVILVSNDSRNRDGCQDASCASENMLLAAHSYGLGASWINVLMTLRDASPVKELLDEYGVPSRHIVWSMIVLGYPAESPGKPAKKESVVKYV